MTNNTRKSALPALALGLAALVSLAPSFATAQEARTERVTYGDLDLTSEAGVKALDRRLDRAVKRVCGYLPGDHPLIVQRRLEQCVDDTWDTIKTQRHFAIARATERRNVDVAENAPRETPAIALSK